MMISSTNPAFISTPLAVIDEGASLASSSTESRRYLPYHLRNTSPNSPPATGASSTSKRRNKDLLAPCGLGNMESLLEKRTGGSTSSGDEKSLSSLEKRRRLGHLEAANMNCEHHHDHHRALEKKEVSAEPPIAITGTGMGALHHYHHQQQHVRDDSPLDTTITVKPCFTAPSHVLTVNSAADDVPPLCAEDNNSTNSPPGSPWQSPSLVGRLLFEEMQKEEPKLVARAAEKLGSIFKHGTPQECAQAVSLGGHSVLVSALKKWHDFEPVVLHCCHAMFRMIGTYTKRCAGAKEEDEEDKFDLVEAFLVMGATSVLVGTLRHYPKSSEVQLFGMGALGNLLGAGNTTSSSSDTSRQAAREFVEELQGTSLICKTMTRFAHKPKVQEFGCWIFARLARMRRFHPILKRQALVAVSTAVQNYPRSGTIERQAASFMGCIFRMRPITANEQEEEEEGHC